VLELILLGHGTNTPSPNRSPTNIIPTDE